MKDGMREEVAALFAVAKLEICGFCIWSFESVLHASDVQYLRDVAQNEDRLNVKAIKLILQVFLQS
jgi:hypothetical protein